MTNNSCVFFSFTFINMNETNRPLHIFLWVLLVACMLVLTKNILFKKSISYYKNYFAKEYRHYTIREGWKKANVKPFYTIKLFYKSRRLDAEYKIDNIGGNIIGFIPLGILFPLLFPGCRKFFRLVLAVFLMSLFFETSQLLFNLGVFDVDDLMLNTVGGIAGYILYRISSWLLKEDYVNNYS